MTTDDFINAVVTAYVKGFHDGTETSYSNEPRGGDRRSNGFATRQLALSERQIVVLRSLVDGESNKSIAQRLSLTEHTIKVHMRSILKKLNVKNRTAAAIWAQSNLAIYEEAK